MPESGSVTNVLTLPERLWQRIHQGLPARLSTPAALFSWNPCTQDTSTTKNGVRSNSCYSLERAGFRFSSDSSDGDRIDMFHHIRSSGTPSVMTASCATPHPITACSSRSRMRAAVSAGTSS